MSYSTDRLEPSRMAKIARVDEDGGHDRQFFPYDQIVENNRHAPASIARGVARSVLKNHQRDRLFAVVLRGNV